MWRRHLQWPVVWLALAAPVWGAEPDPQLRIETGAHSAPVRRLAVSPDQRLVATASDDKTVRIWQLDGGVLVQVLRPVVGPGAEGRQYGVAFHPRRALVAIGGTGAARASTSITMFAPETGEAVRTFDAGPGEIKRLVWSADGAWLVAAFASPGGVKVFSLDGRQTAAIAFKGDCYGVDINVRRQVVATDTGGSVHVFTLADDGGLNALARAATPGSNPVGAAYAPDGSRFAVVYFDIERHGQVDVFRSSDAAQVATWRARGLGRGRTQAVTWNADGTRLAVGGVRNDGSLAPRAAIDATRGIVQEFDSQTGAAAEPKDIAEDSITDLQALADGRFAYASFDASWGLIDRLAARPSARGAGVVRRSDRLWLAADDSGLQWQASPADGPLNFSLRDRVLSRGTMAQPRPPDEPGMLSGSSDWDRTSPAGPRLLGGTMTLAVGEISRAAARIAQSDDVAWGTAHRLARVAAGGRIVWSVEPGTETRAVHSTRDGRFVVAAMADGTFRWYRARDGSLLLSLYALQRSNWVLWSPKGYYDASPGAEPLLGWHVNDSSVASGRFYSIGRFRDSLYRPDVIDRILVDADEAAAVQAANRARDDALKVAATVPVAASAPAQPTTPAAEPPLPPVAEAPADIRTALPPALLYKQASLVVAKSGTVTLEFALQAGSTDPVSALLVRSNGVLRPEAVVQMPSTQDGKASGRVMVQVPPGETVVHLVASNANGFSDALAFTVRRQGEVEPVAALAPSAPQPSSTTPKPRLFALVVGVSQYADPRVNALDLPGKDAEDFAAVLQAQNGRAYEAVETRVLTEGKATRSAILGGLSWLSRSVGDKDFGILFMAGHAVTHPNGSYYFLAHDVAANRIAATAVDEGSIRTSLARLRGRAVLFIDTCHAGNVFGQSTGFTRDVSKIANALASPENGVIVFASSTGRQLSLENKEWGNGAFTKAVVAGLRGGADLLRHGRVTFQGLGYYVSSEVEKLTEGRQTPVVIAPPPGLPDFTLAVLGPERADAAPKRMPRLHALAP